MTIAAHRKSSGFTGFKASEVFKSLTSFELLLGYTRDASGLKSLSMTPW
jgi:hypothetical protein